MFFHKNRFILFFGFALLAMSFVQCNRVKSPIPEYVERIFPLEDGQSRIYWVIDTTFSVQDTFIDWYYRREVINGTETDLLGREVYRLETFRSEYDLGTNYDWKSERIWTVYKDEEFGERMEDNERVLVLKFPAFPDIKWNGNLYNGRGEQEFKYQSIDTVMEVNGLVYDPLVFVLNSLPSDTTSLIKDRLAYELYSPDIGKVMQYDVTKVYDQPNSRELNPDKSYSHIEMLVP